MPTPREVTINGFVEIISHEGIVCGKYIDSVGVETCGIGITQAAGVRDLKKLPFGQELPMSQVLEDFRQALRKYAARTDKAMSRSAATTKEKFDAGVSFDYNTGGINKASWVRTHNTGNIDLAARQILNWNKPAEILGRRRKEQALYANGTYSSDGYAVVYTADNRGKIQYSSVKRVNIFHAAAKLWGANQYDDEADKAREATKGVGGATAGTGVADSIDWNALLNIGSARIFLWVIFVFLAIVTFIAGLHWYRTRRAAKIQTQLAAEILNTNAESYSDYQDAHREISVRGADPDRDAEPESGDDIGGEESGGGAGGGSAAGGPQGQEPAQR